MDYNSKVSDIQKIKAFLLLTLSAIGILFFFGRISLRINPLAWSIHVSSYISKLTRDNSIDTQAFWEFRDMSSLKSSSFDFRQIQYGKPFLVFADSRVRSDDYLVTADRATFDTKTIPDGADIIVQNKSELVYRVNNKLIFKFVKSIEEMKQVNGFFSYFGVDLTTYSNYYWYNETIIKIS